MSPGKGRGSGSRGGAAPHSGERARNPGRPAKYAADEKPQRIGVYVPADLLGWLFDEVARRKRERRDASISEVVSEAVAALRDRKNR
jgi:hypothetical protein